MVINHYPSASDTKPRTTSSPAKMKISSPLLYIALILTGLVLPLLELGGQIIAILIEAGLLLSLAGFILTGRQRSEKFFLTLGILIGGELFFRNFAHRNLPGYMIVEYAVIGVGLLSLPKILTNISGKKASPLVPWLLLCIYTGLSLFYSLDPLLGRWFLLIFTAGLSLMSLSASLGGNRQHLRLMEGTTLGVSLVFGSLLSFQIIRPMERFGHALNSAVQNSIFLILGAIFLMILIKHLRLKWYAYIIPMTGFTLGALFSFSRGPLIGGLIAFIAVLFSDNKFSSKVRNLLTGLIVIGFLAGIVYNIMPEQFLSRYGVIPTDEERVGIWDSSLAAWKDAPYFGWGVGSWNEVYPRYSSVNIDAPRTSSDAHNIFLQVLVETGVIGEFFLLLFIFILLIKVIQSRSFELLGLLGFILVVGFVDNWKILIFFIIPAYIMSHGRKRLNQ